MTELFPTIAWKVPQNPPLHPYFLVACWRGRWAVKPCKTDTYMFKDGDLIKRDINRLHETGWTDIHVLKLPDALWKTESTQ